MNTILQMQGISKSFGGVHALVDVHLDVERGEIHALLGENGAGKSTLMNVLTGVIPMDKGHIEMQGTPGEIFSQVKRLKELRLDVPQVTLLAYELEQSGIPMPKGILTTEEFVKALNAVQRN